MLSCGGSSIFKIKEKLLANVYLFNVSVFRCFNIDLVFRKITSTYYIDLIAHKILNFYLDYV